MRIIAGQAKGRTLVAPKDRGTRPATDRIREALFAILEPDLADSRVLDLFAGAGTMGLEALSRGAASATFVERAAPAIAALKRNVAATGSEDRAELVHANVLGFLDRVGAAQYDIVFVDPPFSDVAVMEATLAHPNFARALVPGATVIGRVMRKHQPRVPANATVFRTKQIGEEDLLFLRYSVAAGGG